MRTGYLSKSMLEIPNDGFSDRLKQRQHHFLSAFLGGIASRYPRISERFTTAALAWPTSLENAFSRQRSSASVWAERRSATCRAKNFSQSCCNVRFAPLPDPSHSK